MTRVAVVDDDPDWALVMMRLLKGSGHDTVHYATPGRLFDALLKSVPDVVLLDMQLPGMHGREVLRVLRANEATRRLLVVAVSAHERGSAEAIKAFESGADEYLAKPVDRDLLLARLSALLRRGDGPQTLPAAQPSLRAGSLVVRPDQRTAQLNERPLELTHLEFDLLVYFLKQPNRVLTRGLILEAVWGSSADLNTRTVDKHVETLRRKLGPLGSQLETVVRVGYLLRL